MIDLLNNFFKKWDFEISGRLTLTPLLFIFFSFNFFDDVIFNNHKLININVTYLFVGWGIINLFLSFGLSSGFIKLCLYVAKKITTYKKVKKMKKIQRKKDIVNAEILHEKIHHRLDDMDHILFNFLFLFMDGRKRVQGNDNVYKLVRLEFLTNIDNIPISYNDASFIIPDHVKDHIKSWINKNKENEFKKIKDGFIPENHILEKSLELYFLEDISTQLIDSSFKKPLIFLDDMYLSQPSGPYNPTLFKYKIHDFVINREGSNTFTLTDDFLFFLQKNMFYCEPKRKSITFVV